MFFRGNVKWWKRQLFRRTRQFEAILPTIKAKFSFSRDRDESESLAVAHAFKMHLSASLKNKDITPGNLAYYSAKLVLSGRQFVPITSMDVWDRDYKRPLPLSETALDEVFPCKNSIWGVAKQV